MMWYWWGGNMPFGWFGGMFFMVLWWALVVWGIVVFVRWLAGQDKQKGRTAMDILKERYAKGEITAHEYEKMKKEIEG